METKYQEVPNIITGKDLDYLTDMFNWNFTTAKKALNYSNNVNDNEYSAINISNMTEVEIISKNDKNVGKDLLVKLDELTIPKEVVDASEEENNESLGFLYFMLII